MRTADPEVSFAAILHQQQSDNVQGQESWIFYFFIMYIDQCFNQLSCTSAEETGSLLRRKTLWTAKRFEVENLFLLYLRSDSISFYALLLTVFINTIDFLLTPVLVSLCSMTVSKLLFHFLFIKGSI